MNWSPRKAIRRLWLGEEAAYNCPILPLADQAEPASISVTLAQNVKHAAENPANDNDIHPVNDNLAGSRAPKPEIRLDIVYGSSGVRGASDMESLRRFLETIGRR